MTLQDRGIYRRQSRRALQPISQILPPYTAQAPSLQRLRQLLPVAVSQNIVPPSNGNPKKLSPGDGETAPVSSLGPPPVLPWSSNGTPQPEAVHQNIDIPDNRHTSTFAVSTAETAWNAHGNEDMHLDMLTEVVDGGEFDEEIQSENLNMDMPSQITITCNLYTTHDASTQMDFSTLSRGTS
ncbi:hypothetical protein JB92DRAFT_3127108 [Gautieria morchelliformis]|nr:hypothetical protein JB92DRAFT_3127108 [Gautieria morchelliformis]